MLAYIVEIAYNKVGYPSILQFMTDSQSEWKYMLKILRTDEIFYIL
ncbi:unnamed protein product [Larinioides sclopetarius]|uniref:Uncharacterized protein n=1 Tax=Larinioides sclopetarius TaxID=280406 RepID=A0AAV2A5X1_9ARAC